MGNTGAASDTNAITALESRETFGTTAAYLRVSSVGQSVDLQRDAIGQRAASVSWYSETASGKNTDRPELKRLMADVRAGKIRTLYVFKIDRLTRSGVADTFKIVDELRRSGVTLYSVADNLCIRPGEDITSDVLVFALGLAARLEWTARNDRVAAARSLAKATGQPWGRPKRMTPVLVASAKRMASEGHSVRAIASALGVPRATAGRAVKAA
jgi:DNA invertase Pin-like site-specific DNA recombinase